MEFVGAPGGVFVLFVEEDQDVVCVYRDDVVNGALIVFGLYVILAQVGEFAYNARLCWYFVECSISIYFEGSHGGTLEG